MRPESDRISTSLRQVVADRAGDCCEYCRCLAAYSPDSFTVDHIQPCQAGGTSTLENLAWACYGCNGFKHARQSYRDPETQVEVSLFHPRRDDWAEHFGWSDDLTEIVGLTACGRATIGAMKLNRVGVMNLRRLLTMAGLHPP